MKCAARVGITCGLVLVLLLALSPGETSFSANASKIGAQLQSGSLCNKTEKVVFNCALRGSGKVVSLCSSRDITNDRGYLQYRFGRVSKIELEFPKDRSQTQQQFHYSHYFRARVDLTEIGFVVDGYSYTLFDNYNGEEKPSISEQGITVSPTNGGKDVTLVCAGRAKANFSNLPEILPTPTDQKPD